MFKKKINQNEKNKAIKYRLYPTKEQEIFFLKSFGCCRKIWNLMLADKIKSYEGTKSFGCQTPAMYKKDYPYLKEVDSLALANVQINLQQAFKNCFDKNRKTNTGFPKYKSAKRSRRSYTTNNINNGTGIIIENKYIKLPKIGKVRAKIHRKPKDSWILKSATISQSSDGKFYASVLFEYEEECNYIPDTDNAIGLDYASNGLYVDHNGNIGTNHKYYRESQEKLAKEQRRLSRKQGSKKGETKSNNYLKQLQRVNKIHTHIANQRLNNLHELSTEIANQYDVVCVESLNMRNMSNKGFKNGKATMDNGYGMFLNMLEYKLKERNKYFVKIDKWYPSSQICSSCGKKHPEMKDLSIREMNCSCGLKMQRDKNAAINIKKEGLRLLAEMLAA